MTADFLAVVPVRVPFDASMNVAALVAAASFCSVSQAIIFVYEDCDVIIWGFVVEAEDYTEVVAAVQAALVAFCVAAMGFDVVAPDSFVREKVVVEMMMVTVYQHHYVVVLNVVKLDSNEVMVQVDDQPLGYRLVNYECLMDCGVA